MTLRLSRAGGCQPSSNTHQSSNRIDVANMNARDLGEVTIKKIFNDLVTLHCQTGTWSPCTVKQVPGHPALSNRYLVTLYCQTGTWSPCTVKQVPGHPALSNRYLVTLHCQTGTWSPCTVKQVPGHLALSNRYLVTL